MTTRHHRIRPLAAALAVTLPALPTLAQTAPEQAPPPAAIAVPAALELGVHATGATARSSVWLANVTDAPIELRAAKGSCGCITLPGFEPRTIDAGRAVEIPLTIRAPKEDGEAKTKKVTFALGAGAPLVVPVTIAAGAPEPIATSPTRLLAAPSALEFGTLPPGASADGTVWLVNTASEPVDVTGARASCGCTTLEGFEPTSLAPGAVLAVPFRTTAPKKPGKTSELKLTFDVAGETPMRVPVTIAAEGAVASGG